MKGLILLCLLGFVAANWQNAPNCGISPYADAGAERLSPYIVGGWQTLPNEFPYQTTLRTNTDSFFCGGIIFHSRHVLTAAHCTAGRTSQTLRVGIGEHDRGNVDGIVTVSDVKQHPNYNPSNIQHDISVVILTNIIEFNSTLRAVCRPQFSNSDAYAGQRLIVSGWGTLSEGGSTANLLRAVDVFGYTKAACRATSYPASWILDGMVCAGVNGSGKDACQGDSGGPLVYKRGNAFEAVGIVSWGQGCARPNYPGVYADVPFYIGWIGGNM